MEPTNQNNPTQNPAPKKNSMPIIIVVLLIILAALIAGVVFWSNSSSDSTSQPTTATTGDVNSLQAQISGESDISTLKADEVVSVSVYVDSNEEPVNAVGATFTYPEDALEFQSIDTSNTAFPTVAASSGGSGTVRIEAGIAPGGEPVSGKQLLAVVQFKSKGSSGEKELVFVDGTQVIRDETFENILGSTQNVKLTFEAN